MKKLKELAEGIKDTRAELEKQKATQKSLEIRIAEQVKVVSGIEFIY